MKNKILISAALALVLSQGLAIAHARASDVSDTQMEATPSCDYTIRDGQTCTIQISKEDIKSLVLETSQKTLVHLSVVREAGCLFPVYFNREDGSKIKTIPLNGVDLKIGFDRSLGFKNVMPLGTCTLLFQAGK